MNNTEKILSTLMHELRLTRAKIALENGVSLQAVSNWCSRDQLPQKAKRYFYDNHGVSVAYLEKGDGPIFIKDINVDSKNDKKYITHLEKENKFLRDLVKTLTDFNNLLAQIKKDG